MSFLLTILLIIPYRQTSFPGFRGAHCHRDLCRIKVPGSYDLFDPDSDPITVPHATTRPSSASGFVYSAPL